MSYDNALAFAQAWIKSWNRRDIEAVLAHYAPHVRFASPKAVAIVGRGQVEGKAALRAYWTDILTKISSLHFELDFAAWDERKQVLTIVYTATLNGQAHKAAEILLFEGELVVRGEATYGAPL